MTRVESIISQVMELTLSEREELIQWMDHVLESHVDTSLSPEIDDEQSGMLTPEQIEEFNRRIDEYKSGAVQGIDADEVFQKIEASLRERRRLA